MTSFLSLPSPFSRCSAVNDLSSRFGSYFRHSRRTETFSFRNTRLQVRQSNASYASDKLGREMRNHLYFGIYPSRSTDCVRSLYFMSLKCSISGKVPSANVPKNNCLFAQVANRESREMKNKEPRLQGRQGGKASSRWPEAIDGSLAGKATMRRRRRWLYREPREQFVRLCAHYQRRRPSPTRNVRCEEEPWQLRAAARRPL